ncbi:FHA domain-containing protein [Anatilimnocola sp. NA78]|uniref:FHA domain-containing protein n=1 Tax=Anatilimnocola sp. NA78 TaxID=3415683 RepID=UPI003CE48B17
MWCNERLIVEVIGPQGVVSTPVALPFARVGSHPDSDVVLPEGPPTGRSLYLHATTDGIFCLDLRRVQSHGTDLGFWLQPTDEVGIGGFWVKASMPGLIPREPPKISLDQDESAPFPRPVLSIVSSGRCVAKKRLQSSLSTVGRWPQCGLHLQGQLVSGVHCALYWHQRRLWCIDLLSSNRTLHREEPNTCVELALGEKIEVGEFEIVFERFSRQRDVLGRTSRSDSAGATASKRDHKGKSLRKAWRELEANPSQAESAGSVPPMTISPSGNSESNVLISASSSGVLVDPATVVAHGATQDTTSDIGRSTVTTSSLPDLQQLEELSRRLQGQFAQLQSEANRLTDITLRLNSASLQWADNRDEILGLLTASLNPPNLQGIAVPLNEPSESTTPKLPAPAVDPCATATSEPCATATSEPCSTPAPLVQEKTVVEPAKIAEPVVSRPLPGGRGSRSSGVKKDELVEFVSDRIALLERQRRWKRLGIGLGIAAATLVLAGAIGGVCYSVSQGYIQLPQWLQPGSAR